MRGCSAEHSNISSLICRCSQNALPPPLPAQEKFVPGRLLREVTVQTIGDAKLLLSSPRIVQAINEVRAGLPGKVVAAGRLTSGDVLVTADCPSTKALLEQERD
jgi:hypothetical protein